MWLKFDQTKFDFTGFMISSVEVFSRRITNNVVQIQIVFKYKYFLQI